MTSHSATRISINEEVLSNISDSVFACRTVVRAGSWLIKNGFGKMMMLPYAAPSGCYWRCEFHPPSRPGAPFFRYSSGSMFRFLESHCGGSVRKNVSPESLAKSIIVSVPENVLAQCSGTPSAETLDWLKELELSLKVGLIPEAFHEYTTDHSHWRLISQSGSSQPIRPQPGYFAPGTEPCWNQTPFWTGALSSAEVLDGIDSFRVSFRDTAMVKNIADELALVLRENSDVQVAELFKAAVAAISKSQE